MEETAQVDEQTARGIADELRREGHSVGIEDVLPVGELALGIGAGVQGLATGVPNTRTTSSRKFLGAFVDRLLKRRGPNDVVVVK